MSQKTLLLSVVLCLTPVIFALSANADEYTCRGSIGPIAVDNLRVPQGATCSLNGTFVKGNIKVETNSTLYAFQVRVIGNVQAEDAALVEVLSWSSVAGSIQIKQGEAARIDGVRIDSDLQFDKNERRLVANNNTIGGNLQVFNNTGGLSINANVIDGNLQCKENRPAPIGGNNTVRGNKEDQCANL